MSVSHPLAEDDFLANSDRDPERAGRDVDAAAAPPSAIPVSAVPEQELIAPERLGLESRKEFRRAAYELVDHVAEGESRLVIGCSGLQSIDSAGLNTLILVQRKAASRRVKVVLRNLDHELHSLLVHTKLDDLFELSDGKPH